MAHSDSVLDTEYGLLPLSTFKEWHLCTKPRLSHEHIRCETNTWRNYSNKKEVTTCNLISTKKQKHALNACTYTHKYTCGPKNI